MRPGAKVGGRYRLGEGPVRGGSGEVWRAHDEELGRDVVLKRVPGAEGTAEGFGRLRAEARALARFSHPHVVTLYDAVRDGRRPATAWLVMEYAPGGSLDARPPLTHRQAAHIGAQIADALSALHAEGIVHADIKPGNVVMTGEGTPVGALAKLADFGAAYRVGGKRTITPNGAVSYTPGYAAPEVVRGRPEPASDVFSLGATVYALVAGQPPRPGWADQDPYLAARRAARGDVELGPAAGPLRDVLTAMLHRDPPARPSPTTAAARLRALAGPPADLPPLPPPVAPAAPEAFEAPQRGDHPHAPAAGHPGRPPSRRRTGVDGPAAGHPKWLPVRGRTDAAGSAEDRPRWSRGPRRAPAAGHPGRPPSRRRTEAAGSAGALRRTVPDAGSSSGHPNLLGRRPGRVIAALIALVVAAGALAVWAATRGGGDGRSDARPGASTGAGPHQAPTAPSSAGSVFGSDPRTADPCALLRPALLARYGQPSLDPAYGGFERCDVLVRPAHGAEADVVVRFVAGPAGDLPAPVRSRGRARLVQEAPDGGECDRDLLLTGERAYVNVYAQPGGDAPLPGTLLCAMADTAAGHALEVLGSLPPGGALPRRSPPLPPRSLARVDACSLLSGHALEVVPGIDAADPEIDFGHWGCSWRSTTGDIWVRITYDRGPEPAAGDGARTRLAGREAFVAEPSDGSQDAEVDVVHRAFTTGTGDTEVETVDLVVGGADAGTPDRRRATAVSLATTAAAALPTP